MDVEVALHVFARHAEGPVWDAASGTLWWIDIVGQSVHRFHPASGADTSWGCAGQPGGVVLDSAGTPIVAAPDGLCALDVDTGGFEPVVPIEPEKLENRCNDAKVDSRGRLWVGTMAYDKRPGNAALHRVDAGSTTAVEGLTISNGPAFDETRGRMYLTDTALGRVDVFDFEVDRGAIDDRRGFLDFSDEGVWPDGMTVDEEGGLWIALGRSGQVRRYTAAGSLDVAVEIPTSNPTSVAFGGPDGRDLYVTTSWFDLPEDDRRGQPLAGALFRCRPGVAGPAGPRFRRSERG